MEVQVAKISKDNLKEEKKEVLYRHLLRLH